MTSAIERSEVSAHSGDASQKSRGFLESQGPSDIVKTTITDPGDSTDEGGAMKDRRESQNTIATLQEEDLSASEDSSAQEENEDGDDVHATTARSSSKSLGSQSSKTSAHKEISSKSIVTLQSPTPSSTVTLADLKHAQEELQRSLAEEKSLLNLQQQLLLQLEKVELSIVKAESEDRIARLACQQAQVIRLLSTKASTTEKVTIKVPS
jgi:hypothetical protein